MDGYYAWMLIATTIVLMMTTPALALFYGGLTRSKSVLNMMMMSYVALAIVAIVFVLWGWSEGGYAEGGYGNGDLIANPFSLFGLHSVDKHNFVFVAFQFTFAAITAALISGAISDRIKFSAWVVFVPVWVTLCYFPIAHNVWGGGWLSSKWAIQDYAGGTVVHINAGIAALAIILVSGKRLGFKKEPYKPHSLPLTLTGAGLLWTGWYGFNVGSIVLSGADEKANIDQFMTETGITFINTTVATAAALLAWLLYDVLFHQKATALGAASGAVAGLVAITPSCGAVNIVGAIAIGAIAGFVCALACGLKYKLGYDDSLDVVGVHLVGGILGSLLIGFFSTHTAPGGVDGLFYGGGLTSLGHQILGVLFTIVWTGVITTLIALAIKYTIGWRIKPDAEVEGIDYDQHGESAYDWGGSASLASSGRLITEGV